MVITPRSPTFIDWFFFFFLRITATVRYKKEWRCRGCVERLESERWGDVIKLIHSTGRLTQGWSCDPERRLV